MMVLAVRNSIAAVMAMEPRYLILDEPTAWLEPAVRRPLLEEVMRWSSDRGAGLVLVTHRMDEAQVCDRVYGMLHGRFEVSGTAEEVLRDSEVRARLALDVPETLELALALDCARSARLVARRDASARIHRAACGFSPGHRAPGAVRLARSRGARAAGTVTCVAFCFCLPRW